MKTKLRRTKGKSPDDILYIKANMVSVCMDKMSVCVDNNWAVLGRFFQLLPVPCGDKQGRAAAAGGQARCHFY